MAKPALLGMEEILTSKPWRLLSYGFDENKNSLVCSNEESIKDCEKDNSYTFRNDGSGIVDENATVCNGHEPVYLVVDK